MLTDADLDALRERAAKALGQPGLDMPVLIAEINRLRSSTVEAFAVQVRSLTTKGLVLCGWTTVQNYPGGKAAGLLFDRRDAEDLAGLCRHDPDPTDQFAFQGKREARIITFKLPFTVE